MFTTERRESAAANAKINLTLRILGRRNDGFHALESIVMPVELHDDVEIVCIPAIHNGSEGKRRAENKTQLPSIQRIIIPEDVKLDALWPIESDLCARAIREFAALMPKGSPLRDASYHINIVKRIPIGGGLGGGSTDAAATLRIMNSLAGNDALDDALLLKVAASIGSDIPALLCNVPVLMQGRGEIVTPLNPSQFAPLDVVIANPGISVSTPKAYSAWDEIHSSVGLAASNAIANGDHSYALTTLAGCASFIENDLETPVFSLYPAISELKSALVSGGARAALMCGSGASVFGLAENHQDAQRIATSLASGIWKSVTKFKLTDSPR